MANSGAIDSESVWFINGNVTSLDPSSKILLNSNFYMFDIHKNYIVIKEIYRKATYLPLTSRLWGLWTPNIGLLHNEAFQGSRRKDLTGVHLRCATLPFQPHIYVTPIKGIRI